MISEHVWREKYSGVNDATIDDTWMRIARALAEAEKPDIRGKWTNRFYEALHDHKTLPAGRIIAGAGTGRQVTLMNCYVMGEIPDSLDGIYQSLRESALTMQQGGGIGNDFSTLRPNGALITKLGSPASGPLPFMDSWDAMCRTIMSAGARRGAMMATLRIDHPDIEAYIEAKRDRNRFRMFNLSVLVTDAFMEAVEHDKPWKLIFGDTHYKTVSARELWEKLMRATYDVADPGVIFLDRINDMNPLRYAEWLTCTNPCGEQPLPRYGACDLGSLNLTKIVRDPFTVHARIDWERAAELVNTLVRMLDNVIDVTHYPLEEQRKEAFNKRRIGVGVTGFANMLMMLGVPYSEGAQYAHDVTAFIHKTAHYESMSLGREKGDFPLFNKDEYKCAHRRNSHVTSIAPTGTISLLAGNVSSGIEPVFDLKLKRKVLQKDGSWLEFDLYDYAYGLFLAEGYTLTPKWDDIFETAADLKPDHHLAILAACTPNVDASTSKTINCPADITFDEFKDIYAKAYTLGCKSCTTYRPNEVTGSILSSDAMSVKPKTEDNVVELVKPLVRPASLHGETYRLKPPQAKHAFFVTINNIEREGRMVPFEMFINTKSAEHVIWTTALTRMVSAIFRKGGDVSFIAEELTAIFDPRGGYWDNEQYTPSIVAGIGKIIASHLKGLGQAAPVIEKTPEKLECSQCPTGTLSKKEGCWYCSECTYSRCG